MHHEVVVGDHEVVVPDHDLVMAGHDLVMAGHDLVVWILGSGVAAVGVVVAGHGVEVLDLALEIAAIEAEVAPLGPEVAPLGVEVAALGSELLGVGAVRSSARGIAVLGGVRSSCMRTPRRAGSVMSVIWRRQERAVLDRPGKRGTEAGSSSRSPDHLSTGGRHPKIGAATPAGAIPSTIWRSGRLAHHLLTGGAAGHRQARMGLVSGMARRLAMHTLYDHLGKTIGVSALSPCGVTEMEAVIAPEPRRADLRHVPDPALDAERERIGLLGKLASIVCLIELYSGAPSDEDAVACLGKLIAFRQQRQREADKEREALKKRTEKENPSQAPPAAKPFVSPLCWMIAARRPAAVLSRFGATAAASFPKGVYFGTGSLVGPEGVLPLGIVDASELPQERETLLVRLMAAGPLLAGAIAELAALDEDAHERVVAEQILLGLEEVLGAKPRQDHEEEEFVVTMQGSWKDARRLGRAEGEASALLTVLRGRGIVVPDAARERILAEKDPERLERWVERALVAASVDEVINEPSRAA